jgi:hypothetical protein
MNSALRSLLTALLSVAASMPAASAPQTAAKPSVLDSVGTGRQYTFAWNFVEGDRMAPRGGTSRGTPVTLAKTVSPAWIALQQPGLSGFERDRRAILAMAGEFRASFDFIEVAGFTQDFAPSRPYQSWGTEKVVVLEDRGTFISLQHMLVMKIVGENGKEMGPFVTKHWRQDWQYEPRHVFRYRGMNSWVRVPVPVAESTGAWSQSVYQVDDSPRYADVARWQHEGNYSSWQGPEGWRPLPRREFTVRSDYHVLSGTNRHTIVPTGWVHEQQNNKLALASPGVVRAESPVVAREFGYNRYERIEGFDFTPADRALAAAGPLWGAVRQRWAELLSSESPVVLRGAPDQAQLFMPLFELADRVEKGAVSVDGALTDQARRMVEQYIVPNGDGQDAGASTY